MNVILFNYNVNIIMNENNSKLNLLFYYNNNKYAITTKPSLFDIVHF